MSDLWGRIGPHSDCWFGEPCAIGKPAECPKEIAAAKREKGTPWAQLALVRDGGGLRHYLEGEPVHCGAGLELQRLSFKSDDYGEYVVPLQEGTGVRYEAQIRADGIRATLHVAVGGHEFIAALEPGMRFRWPKVQR